MSDTNSTPAAREAEPALPRLLVIDDDRKLCRLIAQYLEPRGYQVHAAHSGTEGLEQAREGSYDAVILDVLLPGLDGFEVLKGLRQTSSVPVLMLTTCGEEGDRIAGLEMGADDYLPKPFSTRELLARLRAVMRRTARADQVADQSQPEDLVIGPLRVMPAARAALLADEPLTLTPVEFDLLVSLARARGRVKTRDQLLDEVRDRSYEVFDRSIDIHISRLRHKLGDDPNQPRFIRTIRSVGYLLIDPSRTL
jgi:DNA-binding response OmpR family regulator